MYYKSGNIENSKLDNINVPQPYFFFHTPPLNNPIINSKSNIQKEKVVFSVKGGNIKVNDLILTDSKLFSYIQLLCQTKDTLNNIIIVTDHINNTVSKTNVNTVPASNPTSISLNVCNPVILHK